MKVNDISKVYGVYDNKTLNSRQAAKASPELGRDKLSLSSDAKDFQAVMRGLKDTPDIREDKVNEVIRKYDNPNYYPDYREVAEGLLSSGLFKNAGARQK